jgi:hypothetical protein
MLGQRRAVGECSTPERYGPGVDVASALIGVGGLGVAALTVVLSYRERRAGFRQALYDRQVSAVAELLPVLSKWDTEAVGYIMRQRTFPILTDENRNGMRAAVQEYAADFYSVLGKHAVVLPQHLLDAISAYQQVFNALSAPPEVVSQYDEKLVRSDDPQMALSVAYQRVVAAARLVVGTEPLSAQTAKLLGAKPQTDG